MSVFAPDVFANPPNRFRPLQIVHGLDRFLDRTGVSPASQDAEEGQAGGGETDPAGDWSQRLTAKSASDGAESMRGLDRHLERLASLGVGGIVTNVGFQDYLVSPYQWEVLRYGMRKAISLGLRVWLYDEKGYPSGTAGGIVPRAMPETTALGLACYTIDVEGPTSLVYPMPVSCRSFVSAAAFRDPEHATVADGLPLDRYVDAWSTLRWDVPDGVWRVLYFAERVMYEGTHAQGNVSAFQHYVNLLEPEAVRAFLQVTHEAYRRELPDDIWEHIEAIFTDEPSLMTFYVPPLPERYQGKIPVIDTPIFQDRPMAVPWAKGFADHFRSVKGYDLTPVLSALFYSQNDAACYVRQDYYDVITERYTAAFYGQVQDWCQKHGIASSGHVLLEESIIDHVAFHGSLFAPIRRMDLPGIDMLNSNPVEMLEGGSFMGASFMAVKQVASVAHLTGCEQVHSESSDWEQRNVGQYASLAERRGQANLQYVLGVNQITSYFGWTEFSDEDQRAYHDYVGRLGALLTGGRHVCDVAVLYPVRTLWAHSLPPEKPITTWTERPLRSTWESAIVTGYPALVKTLLSNQIDLDIVDEEALTSAEVVDGALRVGDEAYRVVVLPALDALSLGAVQALATFCAAGGTLVSTGALPRLAGDAADAGALKAEIAALFGPAGPARRVSLDDLPKAVRTAAPPDVVLDHFAPNSGHQMRDRVLVTHRVLESQHVYFIVNNAPAPTTLELTLRAPGPYTLCRPLTGGCVVLEEPLSVALEGYEGAFIVSHIYPKE